MKLAKEKQRSLKEEKAKGEKTKNEKAKKKKTKDKKASSKFSNSKKEKGEEKNIYFIIMYKLRKKARLEELNFSEECETKPENILNIEKRQTIINMLIRKCSNIKMLVQRKKSN